VALVEKATPTNRLSWRQMGQIQVGVLTTWLWWFTPRSAPNFFSGINPE